MTLATGAHQAMVGSIRDRIVEVATDLTTTDGWSKVTMGRLADAVGVSRQTVYNEIGTKQALAEAMVLAELARFLERVDRAFLEHPDDLVGAVRAATFAVLEFAEGNPLLHAIVSATHGADTELLPLLTTHTGALMETAKVVVGEHLMAYDVDLAPERLEIVVDSIVRVVLSHVMQPSSAAIETAEGLAWIAARILRLDVAR